MPKGYVLAFTVTDPTEIDRLLTRVRTVLAANDLPSSSVEIHASVQEHRIDLHCDDARTAQLFLNDKAIRAIGSLLIDLSSSTPGSTSEAGKTPSRRRRLHLWLLAATDDLVLEGRVLETLSLVA